MIFGILWKNYLRINVIKNSFIRNNIDINNAK